MMIKTTNIFYLILQQIPKMVTIVSSIDAIDIEEYENGCSIQLDAECRRRSKKCYTTILIS